MWSIIGFVFLGFSLLTSCYSKNQSFPLLCMLFSMLIGFATYHISVIGLIAFALIGLAYWGYYELKGFFKTISAVWAVFLSFSIFFHVISGFVPNIIFQAVSLSPSSALFYLKGNWDKPIVAFFILFFGRVIVENGKHIFISVLKNLWILLFLIVILLLPALLTRYIIFEPHFSISVIIFALVNLFYVVLVEEAFFRGFLQKELSKRYSEFLAIILCNIGFAAIHYQGGWLLVVFSFIAGLGYSLAYHRSKLLEVAVLTHFSLNMVHFIFFTYPHRG
jgi:uncharacterized protein